MGSMSALKAIKFLILSRIQSAINRQIINDTILALLHRTQSSADYISKIQFGPITKVVDKSASVRAFAYEILTDIIEYNHLLIASNEDFISKLREQLIDSIANADSADLVHCACQSFQILIRSGFILSRHISLELIECITKQIESCNGNQNDKIDSNKKEKVFVALALLNMSILRGTQLHRS